jgi:hypothetical protein
MDPQLLELAPLFERECIHVILSERLPTKVRFTLEGGYKFDLFYRSKTGGYSYTLFKGGQRVISWDNAPHHKELDNFPHHFHPEQGKPIPSSLTNIPRRDIVIVAREVNKFLVERLPPDTEQ